MPAGTSPRHSADALKMLQMRLATVIPYSATNALLPITDMTVRPPHSPSALPVMPLQ